MKLNTYVIAIAILFLTLFTFSSNSGAIEIVSMKPEFLQPTEIGGNKYEDWRWHDYLFHTANVRTNESFYDVTWYVGDEYVGHSFPGDGPSDTEATFDFFWLNGTVTGITYKITAYAWKLDENNNTLSDNESYMLTVYRPFEIERMEPEFWCNYSVGDDLYEGYQIFEHLHHEAFVVTSEPYDRVVCLLMEMRNLQPMGMILKLMLLSILPTLKELSTGKCIR